MSTYLFSGKSRWAKIRTPVEAFDKKNKEFVIDLFPTDKSWVDYKRSGAQLKDRIADDGGRYLTFRRKEEEMDWSKGEMKFNGPPRVYLKDAQSGEYNEWKEGNIGNGSDVTLAVEVYKTKNGNGHRLVRIFVDVLVPYEPKIDEKDAPSESKLPF